MLRNQHMARSESLSANLAPRFTLCAIENLKQARFGYKRKVLKEIIDHLYSRPATGDGLLEPATYAEHKEENGRVLDVGWNGGANVTVSRTHAGFSLCFQLDVASNRVKNNAGNAIAS